MATGDEAGRPAPRSRIAKGEPGTAPVAYLPGATRGTHPAGTGRDSSGREHAVRDGSGTGQATPDRAYQDMAGQDGAAPAVSASAEPDRRERRAANVSMSALTRRGMSRWELERTLISRELDPEVIEAELSRLESVGLIDDAALAETVVRTQHERKGLGRSALTAELRRRHIDQEHIGLALEQVGDDDEASRANELAERRARQLTSLDHGTAVRRLTGYLMRKGYSSSVVRAAVDEALPARGGVRFR